MPAPLSCILFLTKFLIPGNSDISSTNSEEFNSLKISLTGSENVLILSYAYLNCACLLGGKFLWSAFLSLRDSA